MDTSLLEKIATALATEDRKTASTSTDIYEFKPFVDMSAFDKQRCDPYFREVIAGFVDFGDPPSGSESGESPGGIFFSKNIS